jgi:hypothetical protein
VGKPGTNWSQAGSLLNSLGLIKPSFHSLRWTKQERCILSKANSRASTIPADQNHLGHLLRRAGSPKQTAGLTAINSIIYIHFLVNLKFALSRAKIKNISNPKSWHRHFKRSKSHSRNLIFNNIFNIYSRYKRWKKSCFQLQKLRYVTFCVCWCYVLRWIWCLWCYSECASNRTSWKVCLTTVGIELATFGILVQWQCFTSCPAESHICSYS